jgi:hypothetical protein
MVTLLSGKALQASMAFWMEVKPLLPSLATTKSYLVSIAEAVMKRESKAITRVGLIIG